MEGGGGYFFIQLNPSHFPEVGGETIKLSFKIVNFGYSPNISKLEILIYFNPDFLVMFKQ